jgi:hypothetical protein
METYSIVDIPVALLPHIASYLPEVKTLTVFIYELAFRTREHVTSFFNEASAQSICQTYKYLVEQRKIDIREVNEFLKDDSPYVPQLQGLLKHFLGRIKCKRGYKATGRPKWKKLDNICNRCCYQLNAKPVPDAWKSYYMEEGICRECYMHLVNLKYGGLQFFSTTDMRKNVNIPKGFTFPENARMVLVSGAKMYFLQHIKELINGMQPVAATPSTTSKKRKANHDDSSRSRKRKYGVDMADK